MSFDKLLADLQTAQTESDGLAKSLTAPEGADGGSAAGAAAASGDGAGAAAAAAGAGGGAAAAGAEGAAPLVKSLKVTLENGEEAEAIDGTQMLKALEDRIASGEENTTKAVGQLVGLVKSQNAMIKSLGEQVAGLRNEGRGRKTVLAITDRPSGDTLAKSGAGGEAEAGPSVEQFLAKSEAAWKGGAISGKEFTFIDVACRTGVAIDTPLLQKVLGHSGK